MAHYIHVLGAPSFVSASARQRIIMGFYGHPKKNNNFHCSRSKLCCLEHNSECRLVHGNRPFPKENHSMKSTLSRIIMSRNAATYSTFYFHGQYFSHAHGSLAKGPIKIVAQLQCAKNIKKRIFSKYSQMYAVPCMCMSQKYERQKIREELVLSSVTHSTPPFSPLLIFRKK